MPPDEQNPLALHIKDLKGVGLKTADALAHIGLNSVFDLLLRVPKSMVAEEEAPGLALLESGRTYVVRASVVQTKLSGSAFKKRLEAMVQDSTGRMSVVFFGPAVNYAQNLLKTGATVTLIGETKDFLGRMQMVHPKIIGPDTKEVAPVNQASYSQLAGINPKYFKNVIEKALTHIAHHKLEHLPLEFLKKHQLHSLEQALLEIHKPGKENPPSWDERAQSPQFRRLAFEELLSFYLRLFMERQSDPKHKAHALALPDLSLLTSETMPFALTGAQERVIKEVLQDMSRSAPMTRLVQGDVGSGKTAVSALAALHAALFGLQVAVMAPTEILAEQLFSVYGQFFNHKALKLALLTSSTKNKERRAILEQIALGEIHIVIGTHALLSDAIVFRNLGLVIIDEQHRFGVKQRAGLLAPSKQSLGFSPHLLVMSATPIPRSLALTLYGDLDLSIIDERPPGRKAIVTKILSGPVLASLERLGKRIIETQQKAFIVFPLVEESEHLDLENATKAYSFLQRSFGENQCLLLHGRMKSEEKQAVMDRFRTSNVPFLVSTTVIEVGVDIPQATCMCVVHPERFGLAQLHQLRGRVGRAQVQSFCFLLSDLQNKYGTAYKRLNAMCSTENGFELAQVDLDLRGPGELLGTKQAGLPNFLIFNHSDFAELVAPAKEYAKELSQSALKTALNHLFSHKQAHFS